MNYPNQERQRTTDVLNEAQDSIKDTSTAIKEKASSALKQADIKHLVAEHPLLAFGTAVGLGYTFGTMDSQKLKRNTTGVIDKISEKISPSEHTSITEYSPHYSDAPWGQSEERAKPAQRDTPSSQPSYVAKDMYKAQASAGQPSLVERFIPSEIREELSILSQASIEVARQWLRDTMRETFPASREQIDELDRRAPVSQAKRSAPESYSSLS